MLDHAKQHCESKITESVEPIDTRNHGKGRLDPPGGEKSGEARVRPSHIDFVGSRERTRCNTSGSTPGTDSSSVRGVNVCPFPRGASLNTSFPTPFLPYLMLRTCERVSSAGMMNAPSSSLLGKKFELVNPVAGEQTDVAFIRFQYGNTGCKAANHLFDIRNFRIMRGHCMGKRLDAIFVSGSALHEATSQFVRTFRRFAPPSYWHCILFHSKSGREPLGEPFSNRSR